MLEPRGRREHPAVAGEADDTGPTLSGLKFQSPPTAQQGGDRIFASRPMRVARALTTWAGTSWLCKLTQRNWRSDIRTSTTMTRPGRGSTCAMTAPGNDDRRSRTISPPTSGRPGIAETKTSCESFNWLAVSCKASWKPWHSWSCTTSAREERRTTFCQRRRARSGSCDRSPRVFHTVIANGSRGHGHAAVAQGGSAATVLGVPAGCRRRANRSGGRRRTRRPSRVRRGGRSGGAPAVLTCGAS